MSLDTLLEAAKYLELQDEWKERQQKQQQQAFLAAPVVAPVVTPVVTPATPPPPPILTQQFITHQPTILKQPKLESPIPAILQQASQLQHHLIQNSFDIINPLVIDEDGEHKRKQPPLVFRSGTREVHNKLEKHRRAHLKECFDFLKKQLPMQLDEKKTSNLSILHSALRYIQGLKRRERELEHEMERLAREKISAQQRLAVLKKELSSFCDIDFSTLLPDPPQPPSPQVDVIKVDEQTVLPILAAPRSPPQLVKQQGTALSITALPLTNGLKEQVQTTALSVLPVAGYPVSQSIVLHKLAIVPKGMTDITNPVTHFITAPTQPLNGKVLPMVNTTQYVVKPVVVVSSPPSVVPRHS